MNTPINDGGPAFPAPMFTRQADGQPMCPQEFGLGGMSLRDYFAGQALTSFLVSPIYRGASTKDVVERAYWFADAMLDERMEEPK
jgi:hypothetical protein